MNRFEELQKKHLQDVVEKRDKIFALWRHMFNAESFTEHMERFINHSDDFFEGILLESLEKKENLEGAIRALKEEALNLQRLLKTDNCQLPEIKADMPLIVVQMEIDKSLEDLRQTLRKRHEVICELLLQQDALCEELGETPRPLLVDPLPSADEIEDFRNHLEALREERVSRLNTVVTLRADIKKNMKMLQLVPSTDADDRLLNQRSPCLTEESLTLLRYMQNLMSEKVADLEERIKTKRQKILKLWERLEESDEAHMERIRKHVVCNQTTYDVLSAELQRCETLRCQNLKIYVEKVREEIADWWNKTLASDVERQRFTAYRNDYYSEDLLMLHELELDDIKRYYNTNHEIFELFADRKILWDRMVALEAKANEPGRYNNRGGQLLKEERERKTIATKLPKIEKQITDLVKIYEDREHKSFNVHGKNILEVMAADWDRKRQTKEQQSSARKYGGQGQTPQPQYKKSAAPPRTPISLRSISNMSTSTQSLRKTPNSNANLMLTGATTGQLNKRKLNPKDKTTPNAKRSLLRALNSPADSALFLKPPSISKNNNRSPRKRIIATTIKRKSIGRRSNGATITGTSSSTNTLANKSINKKVGKRRSLNKSGLRQQMPPPPPVTIVPASSDSEQTDCEMHTDDTYESFQKYIGPAARSSVLRANNERLHTKGRTLAASAATVASAKRTQTQAQLYANTINSNGISSEIINEKNAFRLPKPRKIPTPSASVHQQQVGHNIRSPKSCLVRSQSTQHLSSTGAIQSGGSGHPLQRTPGGSSTSSIHTAGLVESSRKLTSKNLPIMI